MTGQDAVQILNRSTYWPGLLHFHSQLDAHYDEGEQVWRLRQGDSWAEVDSLRVRAGNWEVRPAQAALQLVVTTVLACLGIYSVAYAAKIPIIAAVTLLGTYGGAAGAALACLAATAVILCWGAYLLAYQAQMLSGALATLARRRQALPDEGAWREPLRLLAVAQTIYVLEVGVSSWLAHQLTVQLMVAMLLQVGVIGGCGWLNRRRLDEQVPNPVPRSPWVDVLGWSAAWAMTGYVSPLLGAFTTLLVAGVATARMAPSLRHLSAHREATTTLERIFWLIIELMLFVSMGALLGHALFWGALPFHGSTNDDYAKQAWVAGATLGTLLALLLAPLGPIRLPLLVASLLYQALLARLGPGPAVLGAIAVILLQSFRNHPGEVARALQTGLAFGLAESLGRLVGACVGLFFLGFEGGPVGAALGERMLGAYSLLKSEEPHSW